MNEPRSDDGSLHLGKRLERMEDALVKILGRLENMVSRTELESVRNSLSLLERNGSKQAQEALQRLSLHEIQLTKIDREMVTQEVMRSQRKYYVGGFLAIITSSGVLNIIIAKLMSH